MAMDNHIQISTGVLRSTAGEVEDINRELRETLNNISTKIKTLCGSSDWQGEAANKVAGKMSAFEKNHFQQYEDIVASYIKFLRDTATDYENREQAQEQNTSRFAD